MPPERESRLETLQGIPERLVAALKSEIRAVTSEQVNDLWMVVQALRETSGGGGGAAAAETTEELQELRKELKTLKKQVASIEADLEEVPEEEDPVKLFHSLEKSMEERLRSLEGVKPSVESDPTLGPRINELEARLAELSDHVVSFTAPPPDLSPIEERLKRLEAGQNGGAGKVSPELLDRIEHMDGRLRGLDGLDRLESRLKTLEEERMQALEAKLKRVERDRLDDLEQRLATLASSVAALKPGEAAAAPSAPAAAPSDTLTAPPDLDFVLDDLLYVCLKHEATELLLKAGSPPVAKLHGNYVPIGEHLLRPEDCRYLVLHTVPAENRKLLLDKKEISVACTALGVRFRVDAYLQRGSVCGVFRPLAARVPSLTDLGLPVKLEELAMAPDGLILVAGPPVSGKTTTLASLVDAINARRRSNIFTIEEPIEYYHQDKKSWITQREVGSDTPSFGEALTHALRQRADVIVLSELKDAETIYAALLAAEAGHLLISSLPSPSTVGALEWILNAFSGEARDAVQALLATTLRAVVSLRLLPRADGKGEVAATEILAAGDLVRNYLQEGMINLLGPLLEAGGSDDLMPFRESLAKLYEVGLVAREGAPRPQVEPVVEEKLSVAPLALEEARPDDTMMGWL